MSYSDSFQEELPYGGVNREPRTDRMSNLGQNLSAVNWSEVQITPVEWNFYKPATSRTPSEVADYLRNQRITIYGDQIPQPIFELEELVAPDTIHQVFQDLRYTKPTPIQAIAWPIILESRDLVGIAKTGSGKTMAFMIPAALHMMAQPPLRPGDGPIVLVMAPTRELAVQIEEESEKVFKRLPQFVSACIYGGQSKNFQLRALRAGAHVVIATPGRLIDMLESRATNLLRVTYLVMDEADRMLDMGFEPQIRTICSQIRTERQTLMFSATWPPEIRNLAVGFLRAFVRVHVGTEETRANDDVKQIIRVIEDYDKSSRLESLLDDVGRVRVLIFVKTKRTVDDLHRQLSRRFGDRVMAIHGDKEQAHRDRVLDRFRRDPYSILLSTDLAQRGLDVKDLDVVVNYDMPNSLEDYVHRVGRTGRAGKQGTAYSFVTSADSGQMIHSLIEMLRNSNHEVPEGLAALSSGGGYRPLRSGYAMGGPPTAYAPSSNNFGFNSNNKRPRDDDRFGGGADARHEDRWGRPPPRRDDSRDRRPYDDDRPPRRRSDSRDRYGRGRAPPVDERYGAPVPPRLADSRDSYDRPLPARRRSDSRDRYDRPLPARRRSDSRDRYDRPQVPPSARRRSDSRDRYPARRDDDPRAPLPPGAPPAVNPAPVYGGSAAPPPAVGGARSPYGDDRPVAGGRDPYQGGPPVPAAAAAPRRADSRDRRPPYDEPPRRRSNSRERYPPRRSNSRDRYGGGAPPPRRADSRDRGAPPLRGPPLPAGAPPPLPGGRGPSPPPHRPIKREWDER